VIRKITKPGKITRREVEKALLASADPVKAVFLTRFFKTGPGEYAEGDRFIGVTVPQSRRVAKQYQALPLDQIRLLLMSPIHEHRLTALLILVEQFRKAGRVVRNEIVSFYLDNLDRVNNWDLVDLSADKILGEHLVENDRAILDDLCNSGLLWHQRTAVIATFTLIRQRRFDETFSLAEKLITHKHDLIHKAVGWMLREVGKRDKKALELFLKKYNLRMPRTMLRYAIERFNADERRRYLSRGAGKAQ
jgi:3-methyladenine DNA glycosylase AlkD